MTPQERAHAIVSWMDKDRSLERAIATAIAEAVQAEREACAMVIEQYAARLDETMDNRYYAFAADCLCQAIIAIRARP